MRAVAQNELQYHIEILFWEQMEQKEKNTLLFLICFLISRSLFH